MPIKAAVVSEERKRLAAQGRLGSAGKKGNAASSAPVPSRAAPKPYDDESSATSSDEDDASSNRTSSLPQKATSSSGASKSAGTAFVDPNEDYAAYSKKVAQQEWLYATGQAGAVPSPPPKQKATAAPHSPAAPLRAARPAGTTTPPPAASSLVAPTTAGETKAEKNAESQEAAPLASFLTDTAPLSTATAVASPKKGATPSKGAGSVPTTPASGAAPAADVAAEAKDTRPVPPTASDLVTEEEESANPGRRDFLKLLDLLATDDGSKKHPQKSGATQTLVGNATIGDTPATVAHAAGGSDAMEEQGVASEPHTTQRAKPPSSMNMEQMTEFFFNQLYSEWLESEADVTFLAAEQWHRAEAMAMLEKSADGMDIGCVHQRMRQVDSQGDGRNATLQRSLRHNAAIGRLEAYVVSEGFVRRVNLFLHKHHPLFLTTTMARERGEHQHDEYVVWSTYGKLMEQLVVGDLKRHVEGFDEEEFFSTLFESENSTDGEPMDGGGVLGGLSVDAWEIILSFLRFEHFCALMDDYIAVHYGVVQPSGTAGVTGVVSALRRSPPPTASRASTVAANDVASRRPSSQTSSTPGSAPTVGATKPKGGASVKAPPTAPKKR